jgi:hypothetical protein
LGPDVAPKWWFHGETSLQLDYNNIHLLMKKNLSKALYKIPIKEAK